MVVADDALPAGHDWLIADFDDGHTAVFLAASGGVVKREEPVVVRGIEFVAIDSGEPFEWEWARVRLACGREQIQWNKCGMAYRLGYALCRDDGTPVGALEMAS